MKSNWVGKAGILLVGTVLLGAVIFQSGSEFIGGIILCVAYIGVVVMIVLFLANVIYKDTAPLKIPRGKEK